MTHPPNGRADALDLFRDFTPEEMQEVARVTATRAFSKGRVLYTPGETGEALFLLREGAVQIYRMSAEGRKLVIAHLLPFSFFGEMSCIGQGMYDTYAEVNGRFLDSHDELRRPRTDALQKPQVARRILEAFGRRASKPSGSSKTSPSKGMAARVAALLLREAEGDEVVGLSHQDLAERLGVYRETATNALNELKSASIIRIGRKRISIIDRERLRRAAGA